MRVVCNDVVSNYHRAIRAETIFPEVPRAKHKLIGHSVSTGSDNGVQCLPRDSSSPPFPWQQAVATSRHGTSHARKAEGGPRHCVCWRSLRWCSVDGGDDEGSCQVSWSSARPSLDELSHYDEYLSRFIRQARVVCGG